MANQLNDFDRMIKNTYESHEFPYDSSAWEGVEKELGTTSPGMLDFFKSVTTGLAIAGVIFATMLIFTSDTGPTKQLTDEQEVNENGQLSPSASLNLETTENFKKPVSEDSTKGSAAQLNRSETNANAESQDDFKAENFTQEQKSTVVAVFEEAKKIASAENSNKSNNSEELETPNKKSGSAAIKRGCTGLSIEFDAPKEYGANAKYLWNFGDGFFSNEENPTHVFNKEGIFDVSLSVTAVGSGQISSNVVQAMIEVQEAPEAIFDLEINSMKEIKLRERSMHAEQVELLVDNDERTLVDSDIILSIADNTKFDIELVAENAASCSDSLQKEIQVIKAGSQFPKMYSSDYASDFAPGAIIDNGTVTDFRVFKTSSGEEIFKAAGSKGWNGKNQKNEEVAKGEYAWMMIVDSEGLYKIYHGALTLR